MTIQLDDILILIGVVLVLFALWALCWQAGLAGTGLAIILGAWWVRGIIVRRQHTGKRRRGP